MVGVFIRFGPENWQIFQQTHGFACIRAGGEYVIPEGREIASPVVYVRILREDSGMEVLGWQRARLLPGEKWEAELTVPAGGLYRLETTLLDENDPVLEWGVRGDMRHHLGVGDLYVIAGQSNSAGYGKEPAYDPPELGVHLCRNSLHWDLASHPMNDSTDSAHLANLEGCNTGACPYLSFAKTLHRELGYPIGLIQSSLGGSPLSQWNPEENGSLYRSMMETLRSQGGQVTGVLWYQGCTDAENGQANSYFSRFAQTVSAFRNEMGAEIPWLTIQLNRRLAYEDGLPFDEGWGTIREAQRQAARKIPGISIVPAIDCSLSDGIHNTAAANVMLGERLAAAALRDIYHRSWSHPAPDLESAVLTAPDVMELTFSPVAGRIYGYDSVLVDRNAFTVWSGDKALSIKTAEYFDNKIRLHLSEPAQEPCQVSAGWQMEPPARLPVDFATHLPILAFHRVEVAPFSKS